MCRYVCRVFLFNIYYRLCRWQNKILKKTEIISNYNYILQVVIYFYIGTLNMSIIPTNCILNENLLLVFFAQIN